MPQHINIKPFHLIGSDERGGTFDFSIRQSEDFILITRKAGSMSGNTYHEGKNKGTNPKTFLLLSGEIQFNYRHIEEDAHQSVKIEAPATIEIQPFVTHSVEAITDMMILECNSISDIQNDRVRENVICQTACE